MSYRERVEPILRMAGELAIRLREEGLTHERKEDGTPVTNADKAVSDFLIAALSAAYPGDGIVSEEHPDTTGMGIRRTWLVDPIDGTKHYVRGGDVFCVMACLVDPEPLFCLAYYPALGRWYYGERGKGAWLIDARGERRLRLVEPPAPPRIQHSPHTDMRLGEAGTRGTMKHLRMIVRGELDCYLSSHVAFWDLATPALLVTEAGGVVVDRTGAPVSFDVHAVYQEHYIAGHPAVVASVLRELR